MPTLPIIALILIATWSVNTRATGTNIYKCGSTYSQTPCDDAAPVRIDDSRTQRQKEQSESIAKNQAKVANSMEKARLKDEAQALTQANKLNQASARAAALASKKKGALAAQDSGKPVVLSAPASKGKNRKEPEYFTAKGNAVPDKSATGPGK